MRKLSRAFSVFAVATIGLTWAPAVAAAQLGCTISLAGDDFMVSIGRIDFTFGYPGGVTMVGHGEGVSCSSLSVDLDGSPVPATFFDDDAGLVSASLAAEAGFAGLGALAICNFRAFSVPSSVSFPITVQSALSPGGAPIVPAPAVVVTSIDCSDTPPTTTLDTTTTTVTTTTITSTSTSTTTVPSGPSCGDPDGSGGNPTATDSLFVLNASVGLESCALRICDVDSSGSVTASDALRVLRVAVGLPIPLDCPA
jgi:hypothetical protein